MIGRGGHRRAGGTPLAICKSLFSGKEQLKKKKKASNSNSMFSFVVIKNVSSSTSHNSHI